MEQKQESLDSLRAENAKLKGDVEKLKRELEATEREKVEYLQNVAHQLVSPLNAIKWHIENISHARVSMDRVKKVFRSIYSQATIAVHLAKNFAFMVNLDADHEVTSSREKLQEYDTCRMLINLADDFQPQGWGRNLTIGVDKESFTGIPHTWAMKNLLNQAFSNIIENAIKYSHDNTSISIRGRRVKDRISITIRNQGLPLGDDPERLFERGKRSEDAQDAHPAGTGYGLFICRRILEVHNGEVSAYTDETRYTVFEVLIPILKE